MLTYPNNPVHSIAFINRSDQKNEKKYRCDISVCNVKLDNHTHFVWIQRGIKCIQNIILYANRSRHPNEFNCFLPQIRPEKGKDEAASEPIHTGAEYFKANTHDN